MEAWGQVLTPLLIGCRAMHGAIAETTFYNYSIKLVGDITNWKLITTNYSMLMVEVYQLHNPVHSQYQFQPACYRHLCPRPIRQ